MIPAAKILIPFILIIAASSFRIGYKFVTFNTSGSARFISTSLSSNLETPFTVYSPILFDTKGSIVTFTPNHAEKKLSLDPTFAEDS